MQGCLGVVLRREADSHSVGLVEFAAKTAANSVEKMLHWYARLFDLPRCWPDTLKLTFRLDTEPSVCSKFRGSGSMY